MTIAVAFATLVIGGGILAGPALLECSASPTGLGACLRDRIADTGLAAPPDQTLERPPIVSDTSSVEPGWVDAEFAEYAAPVPAGVELAAPGGWLAARGLLAGRRDAVADAALAAPRGELGAMGGPELPPRMPTPDVALAALPARLQAGATPAGPLPSPNAALTPAPGALDAGGGEGPAPILEANVSPDATAWTELLGTGTIGAGPAPPAIADLSPADPVPFDEPLIEAAVEALPPAEPAPVIRFDPQYPNVLVLPPPAGGDGSSFATLELN